MKLQRNFIKGKMNKSLDERLIPNGEYIDALNVRIGSTELSEIGSVENSKGNTRITTIEYDGQTLSNDAKCIGAFEDGVNETIYWFITDPSHTGGQPTGKLDLIVSYNTNEDTLKYHVISVNDGFLTNTTLNFDAQYLITGVDKIDNLLFFTDNLNQPRVIDVDKSYPYPSNTFVDGDGDPALFAESLLLIKKPPINSPTFELSNIGSEQNFLVDRFICFAYRYRYENDQYSATSQFTNPAFVPKAFDFNTSSFLNEGMENAFDTAIITFNTGGPLVVGIDLLFKEASNPVIRVIEKLDKEELGYGDNQDRTYEFSNNKIYTVLDDNEILRLYDNVPLKAQAQTVMGSRLVYGNYVDGFDLIGAGGTPFNLEYEVDYISEDIGLETITSSTSNGNYNIDPGSPSYTQLDSAIDIDLSGVNLLSGSRLDISITFSHGSFTGSPSTGLDEISNRTVNFSYFLQQSFNTVQDLQISQNFEDNIGDSLTIKPILDACDGFTFTDLVNCETPLNKVDLSGSVWTKTGSGVNNTGEGMGISAGALDHIVITLPATLYTDGVNNVYEYYQINNTDVSFQNVPESSSLHSDRDYEVGIIYMDEYNRSTTVLVSLDNIVHIPCRNSIKKNRLRVTIPPNQFPPAFASRYKFAVKQDRELYETIYSNFYFYDFEGDFAYIKVDGENAQKIEEGDRLKVKSDSSGPLIDCINVVVLEKKAQEENFIEIENTFIPSGVYIKIDSDKIFIQNGGYSFYKATSSITKTQDTGNDDYPRIPLRLNFEGPVSNPTFIDESINRGDIIKFFLRISRPAELALFGCPKRIYTLEKEYTSSKNYNTFKDWWEGDNIPITLADGIEDIDNQADPFISPVPPKYSKFVYINTPATSTNDIPFDDFNVYFRFYTDSNGLKFLLIRSSNQVCFQFGFVGQSSIAADLEIIKGGNVVIFETETQDAAPDVWYESSTSYPITAGFHEGNVQNQSPIQPAIIDTAFQNCFAFGNGAESFKIRDSITRSTFGLGNRVSSVLKGEEYKQINRFADLTYSGTYSYNVNNLNEFNLGLLNFKALEPSFGFVRKIVARATDILVLQEDKISYVLAGKNLLSDSSAGGAITSIPEVLGTQIARIEEYGISHNPESYAEYGYDKYFTDSKRGVVIQLKGSAYSNEQLIVISNFGMSSWFRNLFLEANNTQKLGAFDPYMKEYVLSSNEILLPEDEEIVDGGTIIDVVVDTNKTFEVALGGYVGTSDLNYNVKSIVGTYDLEVVYDSISQVAALSSVGTGSLSVNKNKVIPQDATINITKTSAGPSDKLQIEFSLDKPTQTPLTIIQVCVSDNADNGKSINNNYRWTSASFNSPTQSSPVSLAKGTTFPLISQYSSFEGSQGNGVAPVDGDTVYIISKKLQSNTFEYDTTLNKLGYLRTNTLYNNNTTDIASLLSSATFLPPPPTAGGTGEYYETFTMPAGTDQYLYLVYDYRKPTSVTLCYSNTSADDACCGC